MLGVAGMIITSDEMDHSRKFPAYNAPVRKLGRKHFAIFAWPWDISIGAVYRINKSVNWKWSIVMVNHLQIIGRNMTYPPYTPPQFHLQIRFNTGWWFQTFFIFHNGIILPIDELIFFKMVKTTNHIPSHGFRLKRGKC